jgi:hypothetical protein
MVKKIDNSKTIKLKSPYSHCPFYPYDWDQQQESTVATYSRKAQNLEHKAKSLVMKRLSGF